MFYYCIHSCEYIRYLAHQTIFLIECTRQMHHTFITVKAIIGIWTCLCLRAAHECIECMCTYSVHVEWSRSTIRCVDHHENRFQNWEHTFHGWTLQWAHWRTAILQAPRAGTLTSGVLDAGHHYSGGARQQDTVYAERVINFAFDDFDIRSSNDVPAVRSRSTCSNLWLALYITWTNS